VSGAAGGYRGAGRRGEAGQALLLALVVLFFASLAASLVAMDLRLRETEMREAAVRAHLRELVDGALAEALARLDAGLPVADSLPWPAPPGVDARSGARVGSRSGGSVQVWVWATWAGRHAGAQAEVLLPEQPEAPPRVVAWRRLPAATAAAMER
jgi:hypothetical protein